MTDLIEKLNTVSSSYDKYAQLGMSHQGAAVKYKARAQALRAANPASAKIHRKLAGLHSKATTILHQIAAAHQGHQEMGRLKTEEVEQMTQTTSLTEQLIEYAVEKKPLDFKKVMEEALSRKATERVAALKETVAKETFAEGETTDLPEVNVETPVAEEVEPLDEISDDKKKDYLAKAGNDQGSREDKLFSPGGSKHDGVKKKYIQRRANMMKTVAGLRAE